MDIALNNIGMKVSASDLKLILKAVSWRVETASPVIAKVHKPGKTKANPLYGMYEAIVDSKPAIVEYEADTDLRDTEQVPLLEDGGVEAFIRREVLPYTPDAWIKKDSAKIGYEISFTRQFYEAYAGNKKVTPLVTQLPWTHNLIILTQAKRPEEREFYLRMAIAERWGKRELEKQFQQALFEHTVLHPPKLSPAVRQIHGQMADQIFKDSYFFEFLDLPADHTEDDLHHGLLNKLREFLIELGRDFCFVGSEYPVQVGGRDFALDLLFFHRELNCLVAIELKVGRFEPEYLGKLEFYLEALDRDHRKPHENPAISLLLCASKDKEVVEYALSRSLSPALIAEYQTKLPDKKLLAAKLHEFYALNVPEDDENKTGKDRKGKSKR